LRQDGFEDLGRHALIPPLESVPSVGILQELDGRGELPVLLLICRTDAFLFFSGSIISYPRGVVVDGCRVGLVRFEVGCRDEMVSVCMRRFVFDDIGKGSGW